MSLCGSSDEQQPMLRINNIMIPGWRFPVSDFTTIEQQSETSPAEVREAKRSALQDGLGFYATESLVGLHPDQLDRALAAVEGLCGELVFTEGDPQHVRCSQLPEGVRELAEWFDGEARALGYTGVISDARIRISSTEAPEHASEPFLNFHVDVPIVHSLFLQQLAQKFGDAEIDLSGHPELERRFRSLGAEQPATLNAVLGLEKFSGLAEQTGFMYRVHQRVAAEAQPPRDPAGSRAAAAGFSFGGVAADAACSSEEEEEEEEDWEDQDEEWQPVGGQLNCWFQLNRDHLALPSLGFLPMGLDQPICQVCAEQPVFDPEGSPAVTTRLQQLLAQDGAHVLLRNKRGVALLWDAKRVWHSAVWLQEAELQTQGVRVSNRGRDSVELRFHVLEQQQLWAYLRVLLDELCKMLQ